MIFKRIFRIVLFEYFFHCSYILLGAVGAVKLYVYYIKPAFGAAYNNRPYGIVWRFNNKILHNAHYTVISPVFYYLPNRVFKAHGFYACFIYYCGSTVARVGFQVYIPALYYFHPGRFYKITVAGKIIDNCFVAFTLPLPLKPPRVTP